ncbi:hypothetical protein RMN56_20770 [Micromonospora halotolerans]|uniref:FXSXX-COOH protein n=1 Tax=Micromonospora halotolerans TaxID=709879 RepID=A0ABY9ZQT3_9ACTN|nr:hypothetical protein [Micromonospora halotolerans]WNM37589.1 hypothetical protein RMN56_20770 [Micromonospora halotolerans]
MRIKVAMPPNVAPPEANALPTLGSEAQETQLAIVPARLAAKIAMASQSTRTTKPLTIYNPSRDRLVPFMGW